MPRISVRDNGSSRWKKTTKNNTQKSTDRKEHGGTEATVKGWELNYFVVHLSYIFSS